MVRSAAVRLGKRADRQACQPFRLQRKMTFAKVVSLCCCVAAFGVVVAACGVLWPPFPPLFLSFGPLKRHPPLPFHHAFACMPVCRQAQGQADWQAGWQGCQPGSRQACRPFRLQRKGIFSKVVSLCYCVAAFGVVVAACGVLYPALSPFSLRFDRDPLLDIHTIPMPVCLRAGRQVQGQADWQAGEQAGGQESLPPGKKECLRFVGILATNR